MSNNWRKQKLSVMCTKIGDGLHGTPKYCDNTDLFFVNGNNLKNGKIEISKDTKTVSKKEFEKYHIQLDSNSLLLGINGSIGNMAFYNGEKVMLGKSSAYLNFKTDINKFYYYYFQLTGVQKYFYDVATGSTIKNLSLKSLQDFIVPVPEEFEYRKISFVLSSFDSKIELNNKINTELESMAKTLYDYWFVQFDFPDENGKPYKSSGGEMVWSDELKREIPKGWDVKTLNKIESNIITGKTPSTKVPAYFNGDIPFICIGDVRGDMHIVKTSLTLSKVGADTQKNKYIPKGAICVTCIASPGLVGFATENSQTNQQLNSIVCEQLENKHYLYFYLQDYFKYAKAKTGNTFANMNKDDFSSIIVIKPNNELLVNFSDKIGPMIEQILINTSENLKLAKLRDWILPMLMNGQVSVE